ncbi:MAG: hypothetical protein QXW41_03680 [Fervidicoccaceae archaeon]
MDGRSDSKRAHCPRLEPGMGRLVGALPLPRGLSDFVIVLAVASLLVLLYKLNRM